MRLRPALYGLAIAGLVAACAADHPAVEAPIDPNEGLLRDFLDGKFDAEGHPLNAKVVLATDTCSGTVRQRAVELRAACEVASAPRSRSARTAPRSWHPDYPST